MALDRFVIWAQRKPTLADIETFLEDYFAGAATFEKRGHACVIVRLPGAPSHPFRRLAAGTPMLAPVHAARWIEVVLTNASADVLTRQQDEYTNTLADGLAVALERFWKADWRNRE